MVPKRADKSRRVKWSRDKPWRRGFIKQLMFWAVEHFAQSTEVHTVLFKIVIFQYTYKHILLYIKLVLFSSTLSIMMLRWSFSLLSGYAVVGALY